MKQIITLLLVILVSIPVNGQMLNQNNQKSENLTTTKFFNPLNAHNNRGKDFQTRNLIVQRKTERLKSSSLEKRYLDSLTNHAWDKDNNLWRFSSKEVYTYNNDKVEMSILYVWDTDISNWKPFQKDEYTFDSNGNLISEVTSYQFTPGLWVPGEKTEYTYFQNIDNVYKLSLEQTYSWNTITSQWASTYKYELTYDSNGTILISDIGYEWDSFMNQWVNMYKDEFFYDSGRLSYEINYLWDYGASDWDLNSKWEYFYNGFPIFQEIEYRWEPDPTNDWIFETKYDYEWIPWGGPLFLQTRETGYNWDIAISQWENDYKDEYQYDGNGNRTIGTYFRWNETPGEWAQFYKDEFICDLSYNFSDLIGPFYYDEGLDDTIFYFNNMVIGYRGYEYINPIWEDTNKILFYYSNYTNPLQVDDKILADAIKLYPNPVNNKLTIDSKIPLTKVEFYSLIGKKIMEVNKGFDAIPLSNLSDGIYLVRISADNKIVVKKIIKRNMIL